MLSAFQKKKKKLSSKLQIQILNFISIALPHYIQIATHCFFTVSLKRVHTTHLPRLNHTILVLSFPCACVCVHVCVCLFSCISLFATPWTAAWHAPLSIEFSRQEYWIELSFPTPGDLLNAGVKPVSLVFPALAGRFFTTVLPGKPPFPNHFILRKSIRPQQENYLTTPDLLSVDSYCQEQRKFYFFQTKVILTVSFAYSLNSNQWLNHTYNKSYYSIKVNKIESFMLQQCTKISLYSLVQFSRSLLSDTLRSHGPQHARPPRPSPTPRVYPNPGPLSQWCHATISSSVAPFSSCPQSLPASGSFQMSQLFTSGSQSIGVSASISILLMNTQDWSPLGWMGWISLQSKGLSRVFSNTTVQNHQFFSAQFPL